MDKLKILLAVDSYSYATNGVVNVVLALKDGLSRMGHEVKVLTLADGHASARDGDVYSIRSFSSFLYPDFRLSLARHDPLLNELIQWKPDLIHLHTEASVARMVRAMDEQIKVPVIMTAHTDYAYYAFKRFRSSPPVCALMNFLGKRVYRDVTAITVPSEKARAFPQFRTMKDRVVLVPNGIKLEKFQKAVSEKERAEMLARYGLADSGCTLAMITRVSREKNIMEILRYLPALLRELPEAQLLIVGDGPDRKRLEKYCARGALKGRVVFTGRIPQEELYRYYAMGDVFVSASVFEVHSLSYLEAMACGLPLVCREDACLRGVLADGENGFIYRTEAEFTRSVAKIVRDKALKRCMHERALEKVKAFSEEKFVENMVKMYHDVLAQQRPNGSA